MRFDWFGFLLTLFGIIALIYGLFRFYLAIFGGSGGRHRA